MGVEVGVSSPGFVFVVDGIVGTADVPPDPTHHIKEFDHLYPRTQEAAGVQRRAAQLPPTSSPLHEFRLI